MTPPRAGRGGGARQPRAVQRGEAWPATRADSGTRPQGASRPAAPPKARPPCTASLPREVRIVGGTLKRSRLAVPLVAGLRPTPDRVRETLFNWLGGTLDGWRVADVFAGSGALGIEAASRGAARVTLVERAAPLAQELRGAVQRLGVASTVDVVQGEALAWLAQQPPSGFELLLLDPPFDAPALLARALEAAPRVLVDGGWLYVESAAPLAADAWPHGLEVHRQARAGAVHYHLARRVADDAARSPA